MTSSMLTDVGLGALPADQEFHILAVGYHWYLMRNDVFYYWEKATPEQPDVRWVTNVVPRNVMLKASRKIAGTDAGEICNN